MHFGVFPFSGLFVFEFDKETYLQKYRKWCTFSMKEEGYKSIDKSIFFA